MSLGDGLERVDKVGLLRLLPKLQRENGSFGEWLGPGEAAVGESDPRFILFACAIRWMLRGREGNGVVGGVPDFDVEKTVNYIRSLEVSSWRKRGEGEWLMETDV